MTHKYNKNKENLLFAFTKCEFPQDLIQKECMQHREIVFSQKETDPELYTSKIKAVCYVVEDSLENKKKGGKFTKGPTNPGQKRLTPTPNQQNWNRKTEAPEEETGDFFDNFKGKTDQSQVNKFLKEKKFESLLQVTKENNIFLGPEIENKTSRKESADNTINSNHSNNSNVPSQQQQNQQTSSQNKIEINYSKSGKGDEKTIDKFFEDFDTTQNKVFTINCIYKVNDFLSYPKEEPLWYFYHESAKSSFGPISSKKLEEMFNSKIIDQTIQIRFIDLFSHKLCKKPFSYFKLSDIDRSNFVMDIELSSLFYAAENIIKNAKRNHIAESKLKEQPLENEDDLFTDFGKSSEKKEKMKKPKGRPVDVNVKLGNYVDN
jgi:hypothetical protein